MTDDRLDSLTMTADLLHGSRLAHKNCEFYPNISTILSLLLILPVGSCSCERSISSLRRLNNDR